MSALHVDDFPDDLYEQLCGHAGERNRAVQDVIATAIRRELEHGDILDRLEQLQDPNVPAGGRELVVLARVEEGLESLRQLVEVESR